VELIKNETSKLPVRKLQDKKEIPGAKRKRNLKR
jgi:hypothetical protein